MSFRKTGRNGSFPTGDSGESPDDTQDALEEASRYSLPQQPRIFVPRPALANAILRHFRSGLGSVGKDGPTVALVGTGGYGKTTLARWLGHQSDMAELFPDGVVWIDLGKRTPLDLLMIVNDLIGRLGSPDLAHCSDLVQAAQQLGEILNGERRLLVLDRAWKRADIEPFLVGGRRCGRLITTTIRTAFPEDANVVGVEAMSNEEAADLLADGLAEGALAELQGLLPLAGSWPVLLKVLNAVLRQEVKDGASLSSAVTWVTEMIRSRGPAAEFPIDDPRLVATHIEVGLEALKQSNWGEPAFKCYQQLAIFPDGVDIPVEVLDRYWKGLPPAQPAIIARVFKERSLVESFDAGQSTLRLHPVIRRWLRHDQAERMMEMNNWLLDAYRASRGRQGWWTMPAERAHDYLWRHLAFHLFEAGRCEELVATVTDLRYLVERCSRFGVAAADADLSQAQQCASGNAEVFALQGLLRAIARHPTWGASRSDIAATLAARLVDSDSFRATLADLAQSALPPTFWPLWSVVGTDEDPQIGDHGDQPINGVGCDTLCRRGVSAGADGTIRIWDVESGEELAILGDHGTSVNSVSLDESGTRLASGGADGVVRIWEVEGRDTGAPMALTGHNSFVNSVSLDGDGRRVASAGADGSARVWELDGDTSRLLCVFERHRSFVNSVSFSAAGERVVSGGADNTVRIWDAETGEQLGESGWHDADVNSVSFDSSGDRVVSGGADGHIRIWDARSMVQKQDWVGHGGHQVRSVRFDGPGLRVISGGEDCATRVWDAESGTPLAARSYPAWVRSVACDDSGTRIVSACANGQLRLCTLGQRSSLEPSLGMVKSVACSGNGQHLVTGGRDGAVLLRDVHNGSLVTQRKGHGGFVNDLAWDLQNERVVSAGADGSVRVWRIEGDDCLVIRGHGSNGEANDQFVNSAAFDRSGDRIVSGGADGTIRIWDAFSGKPLSLLAGHRVQKNPRARPVNSTRFDPANERIVSAGADGTVRIWHVQSRTELFQMTGHGDFVNSAEFDSSGTLVVSGGYDGTVRIWDAEAGEQVHCVGRGSWVESAAFLEDNNHVVCGRGNGTVEVWKVDTNERLAQIDLEGSVFTCVCGPDGTVAVGTGLGLYLLKVAL